MISLGEVISPEATALGFARLGRAGECCKESLLVVEVYSLVFLPASIDFCMTPFQNGCMHHLMSRESCCRNRYACIGYSETIGTSL